MEMQSAIDLVFSIATLIASLGAVVVAWGCYRRIAIIYHATNSMKDELIAEVRASEHAKGLQEGLALGKTDND